MGIKTEIEWCDSTVNGQMGCTGCELWNPQNGGTCYAAELTNRYAGNKGYPARFELPQIFPDRIPFACAWPDLTGKRRPDKPHLDGFPRLVFVDDMGDTWTEGLPEDWIVPYFAQMEASPHRWLFLTKRPARMLETFLRFGRVPKNFWLGISITAAANAGGRYCYVKPLKDLGASVVFLSFEPLLGDVAHSLGGVVGKAMGIPDWAIVGGESGPKARPWNPQWIYSLMAKLEFEGCPLFFKQHGEWLHSDFWRHVPGAKDATVRYPWGDGSTSARIGKKAAGALWYGSLLRDLPQEEPWQFLAEPPPSPRDAGLNLRSRVWSQVVENTMRNLVKMQPLATWAKRPDVPIIDEELIGDCRAEAERYALVSHMLQGRKQDGAPTSCDPRTLIRVPRASGDDEAPDRADRHETDCAGKQAAGEEKAEGPGRCSGHCPERGVGNPFYDRGHQGAG